MTADCRDCTRLTASVARTDALTRRAAHLALTNGPTAPLDRYSRAHDEAVNRLEAHTSAHLTAREEAA